jgi:hypothetical protein
MADQIDKARELAAANAKAKGQPPPPDREAAKSDESLQKRTRKKPIEPPPSEAPIATIAPVTTTMTVTTATTTTTATVPASRVRKAIEAKPTAKIMTVTTHISSDSMVLKVIEQKGGWARLVALVVAEIKADPDAYAFQGGLTAVKRRLKLLSADGLKVEHLKWFLATCEGRGHRIVNYAKKDDASGNQLKALNAIWKFKGKKGTDPVGSVSVIAAKVALPELFIAFRNEMGAASFGGGIVYTGPCPVVYQWLGSLAAMYHSGEEEEDTWAEAIADYIEWYEDFQTWYIDVRNAAAKVNNSNANYKAPSKESVDAALIKSRSFYHLALSSYSVDTRREWSKGNYSTEVSQGVLINQNDITMIIDQMFESE